jgi:hypothetical protein
MSSGGGVECGSRCRRVFKGQELGNLAVPELVDVRPLLLKSAVRRLDETALEAQDDDRAALRDELAGLEPLEFKVPPTKEKNSATPSRPRRVPAKGITEGP